MSASVDNFDWMDEPMAPARPGEKVKKGQSLSPEAKLKYAKNGTHRKKGAENVKVGQTRLANGTLKQMTMTDVKWRRAIELIAEGVHTHKIHKEINVTPQIFKAYLITNVSAHKQIEEARLLWLRRDWSLEEIDEILNEVALGKTVKASCKLKGYSDSKVAGFYRLMRGDRAMRDLYDAARELQAESWLDDSIDIADDSAADWYEDDKGVMRKNHEIIQRSKLRIDQRNWSSGALNRKRFGDHKHVEHEGNINVNHAALLGGARKRLEGVQKQRGVTVEGEAAQVDRAGAQAK